MTQIGTCGVCGRSSVRVHHIRRFGDLGPGRLACTDEAECFAAFVRADRLSRADAQAAYDTNHAIDDHHCLKDPCPWHPGETRIRPTATYPATLRADEEAGS